MMIFAARRRAATLSGASLINLSTTQVRHYTRKVPNQSVIVLQDFNNLFENDVVKVRSGYMRNYLYPNKIAKYATEEALEELKETLTPQKVRDLEEKKKGDRITKILKKLPVIELSRNTRGLAHGQRRELSKKIDPLEFAKMISDQLGVIMTPKDIVRIYLPDMNAYANNFQTHGIQMSGLYEVMLQTSKFTTGVVKFNLLSVPEKEDRRAARRQQQQQQTTQQQQQRQPQQQQQQQQTAQQQQHRQPQRQQQQKQKQTAGNKSSELGEDQKEFLEAVAAASMK